MIAADDGQLESELNRYEEAFTVQSDFVPTEGRLLIYIFIQKITGSLGSIREDRSNGRGGTLAKREPAGPASPPWIGPRASDRQCSPGSGDSYPIVSSRGSEPVPSGEDSSLRRTHHEQFVSQWLAISVKSLSPFRSSSVAARFDRNPETCAIA